MLLKTEQVNNQKQSIYWKHHKTQVTLPKNINFSDVRNSIIYEQASSDSDVNLAMNLELKPKFQQCRLYN